MKNIELTLSQLLKMSEAAKLVETKGMNATLAYRISKITGKIRRPIEDFNKARKGLVEKFSDKPAEGKKTVVKLENVDDFMEELNALAEETESFNFPMLKLEHFGDMDVPPAFFEAFSELIEE